MIGNIYRYQFTPEIPAREINETLRLALLAAECLHGESWVRIETSYCLDAQKRVCVIDAGTAIGHQVVRLFTGFAAREFGERAFTVRRMDRVPGAEVAGATA